MQQNGAVASPDKAGATREDQRHAGTCGKASVLPSDPIVTLAKKAAERLKHGQPHHPIILLSEQTIYGLFPMLFGGDQDIQVKGRPIVAVHHAREAFQAPFRNGRLEESRNGKVRHGKSPGGVVMVVGRQRAKEIAPVRLRPGSLKRGFPSLIQGHHGQLTQEGVPGVALMRAQPREIRHDILGEQVQHPGERSVRHTFASTHANEGIDQEIVIHEGSFSSPYRS